MPLQLVLLELASQVMALQWHLELALDLQLTHLLLTVIVSDLRPRARARGSLRLHMMTMMMPGERGLQRICRRTKNRRVLLESLKVNLQPMIVRLKKKTMRTMMSM